MDSQKILEVSNVKVSFFSRTSETKALNGVSFEIHQGEVLGIVGESGSGKSVSMNAVMRMLPQNAKMIEGTIKFCGNDMDKLSEDDLLNIRGSEVSMIFQDPMSSLDPLYMIGDQLEETIIRHKHISHQEAKKKAIEMLNSVGISDPERRVKQYPHELSGGMRQRVVIAMALICSPKLLIADEPTTALDVTIQAQIIELIKEMHQKTGNTIAFITHNLGIIADLCDTVVVMYAGRIVEKGTVDDIFYKTAHPYTEGLLDCIPKMDAERKKELTPIEGNSVNLRYLPQGCAFSERCGSCMNVCLRQQPPEFLLEDGHSCSCWLQLLNGNKKIKPNVGSGEAQHG